MNLASVLRTVFEIVLVGFTVWAVFNEDRFIMFEEKIMCNIRRKKMKTVRSSTNEKIIKLDF